ncbi:hypothetical protein O988_08127 [Pseudogymnoascus sp. VKM F-3808]|nr:hypothetical protein O988_08127 [Pseudogymnoascus sp. VKM F-3808]
MHLAAQTGHGVSAQGPHKRVSRRRSQTEARDASQTSDHGFFFEAAVSPYRPSSVPADELWGGQSTCICLFRSGWLRSRLSGVACTTTPRWPTLNRGRKTNVFEDMGCEWPPDGELWDRSHLIPLEKVDKKVDRVDFETWRQLTMLVCAIIAPTSTLGIIGQEGKKTPVLNPREAARQQIFRAGVCLKEAWPTTDMATNGTNQQRELRLGCIPRVGGGKVRVHMTYHDMT